jgi:hypothetical protein
MIRNKPGFASRKNNLYSGQVASDFHFALQDVGYTNSLDLPFEIKRSNDK